MNASESLIKTFENMRFGNAIKIHTGIIERRISPLTQEGGLWIGISSTMVENEKYADPELVIFGNQDDAEKNINPLFRVGANCFDELNFNFIGMVVPSEPLPLMVAQIIMEIRRWIDVK